MARTYGDGLYGDCYYGGADVISSYSEGHIDFPGVDLNFASVADSPALNILGDLCLVFEFAPDDATPSGPQAIASKWVGGPGAQSWVLFLQADGSMLWTWWDGAVQGILVTIPIPGLVSGAFRWVAVAFDVDAAGSTALQAMTSPDGVTWATFHTPSQGGVTVIAASVVDMEIASFALGAFTLAGNLRHLSLRDGIGPGGTVGGVEVFRYDADPDLIGVAPTAPSFEASSGQTVTIHRSGSPGTLIVPTIEEVCSITYATVPCADQQTAASGPADRLADLVPCVEGDC